MENKTGHIENDFTNLVGSYLEGELTMEQEPLLFEHLSSDKSKKELFYELEHNWMSEDCRTSNFNDEWAALVQRMDSNQLKSNHQSKYGFGWFLQVAAIVALFFSGGFFVYNFLNKSGGIVTVEAPYGEKSKVILPDGSVIWLNSGSKLTYGAAINKSVVEVEIEGEGYFEVVKNTDRKFVVHTSVYDVEVKGTKFNITAYPEDRFVTTTLLEGKIHVNHNRNVMIVNPGESVSFDRITSSVSTSLVAAEECRDWIENVIVYDNISLGDLVKKLSRKYNLTIVIESQVLRDKTFSIALRNGETLNDIFQALELILNVNIEEEHNIIHIKKDS